MVCRLSAELVTSIALFGADDTTQEQVPLDTGREDATTKIFRAYTGRSSEPGKSSPAPANG
ncbi:hypothetical protein [Streptomyces oceani]|uniref:Uncharacterized protein n=1 Tax=Streptomyces oceani TaxID=1075402 RepID=A0A1E7KJJ8_9ACTN|nr:hypothetical protein [Streptomyces oceani]OEV04063.1 hypothetical protein AN216_07360 [Streptomyces oceani]